MDYKYYSKSELRSRCVSESMRMIKALRSASFASDGSYIEPLMLKELASILHLTITQMSRVSTGVCVPTAPVLLRLQELYKSRLENGTL